METRLSQGPSDSAEESGQGAARAYRTPSLKHYGSLTGLTSSTMDGGIPDGGNMGKSGS